MQLTLVSHYGAKPRAFTATVSELQSRLRALLGAHFSPYESDQVHGTIVGLEGERSDSHIVNANFRRFRGVERPMDFSALLRAVKSVKAFHVRVGGFQDNIEYEFKSNGASPFIRAFSIQGDIAVAMGWPWERGQTSPVLFDLRKSLETFGVLHKWHRHEQDCDNDFFFVLGRVNRTALSEDQLKRAEDAMRGYLASGEPLVVEISCESLAFVAYNDPQLPFATSRGWRVNDPELSAETLVAAY